MNERRKRSRRRLLGRSFEAGVTTLEYSIMLVLVSLAVSTFGLGLGGSVTSVFSRMVSSLSDEADRDDNDQPRHKDIDEQQLN